MNTQTKQTIQWVRLVSLGYSAVGIEYKKDSPWVLLSPKDEQNFLRPGYKAERAIRLGTEENIQVFL